MQSFSGSLPMMLYSALDAVMPRFRKIFKKFGLTEQQWRVLRVLWEIDSIALQSLADITLIPAPSLVGVIDRLETSDLVERRRSKSDRRVVYIHATKTGQKLEQKVRPEVDRLYAELQASIDPQVWDKLFAGLDSIIATCGSEKPNDRTGG
jgi:homoprotocatechuate degradation regulator HpaR